MRVMQENSHEWRGKSDVHALRETRTIEQWSIEVKTLSKSLINGHEGPLWSQKYKGKGTSQYTQIKKAKIQYSTTTENNEVIDHISILEYI